MDVVLQNFEFSIYFLDPFFKRIIPLNQFFSLDLPSLLYFIKSASLGQQEVWKRVQSFCTSPPNEGTLDALVSFLKSEYGPPEVVCFDNKPFFEYFIVDTLLPFTVAIRKDEVLFLDGCYNLLTLFSESWQAYISIRNKETGLVTVQEGKDLISSNSGDRYAIIATTHKGEIGIINSIYHNLIKTIETRDDLHSSIEKLIEGLPKRDGLSYVFIWSERKSSFYEGDLNILARAEDLYQLYKDDPRFREQEKERLIDDLITASKWAGRDISSLLAQEKYKEILDLVYEDKLKLHLLEEPCVIYTTRIRPSRKRPQHIRHICNEQALVGSFEYEFYVEWNKAYGNAPPPRNYRNAPLLVLLIYTAPDNWVAYEVKEEFVLQHKGDDDDYLLREKPLWEIARSSNLFAGRVPNSLKEALDMISEWNLSAK
jgi:hypothetical protein